MLRRGEGSLGSVTSKNKSRALAPGQSLTVQLLCHSSALGLGFSTHEIRAVFSSRRVVPAVHALFNETRGTRGRGGDPVTLRWQ